MYKAVLFDLDGVICDTAHYHYLAWKKLAQQLGGDIDIEFNEKLKGVDRKESLIRILKHINLDLTIDEINKYMTLKNDWYVQMLQEISKDDILPGIEEFIEELKKINIKIAIASSSKNAPIILDKIGLLDKVDTIANPEDIKNNKPAPDIFLLAAKQLNLELIDCIGIEDSQAGIEALNKAKIDSIAIGNNLEDATITLKNTAALNINLLSNVH